MNKEQFVINFICQFLASSAAIQYQEDPTRIHHMVEDAEFIANEAYNRLFPRKFINDNL